MQKNDAAKAIKHGTIAGCVLGSLTLLIVVIAIAIDAQDATISQYNDPWSLLDVGFIFFFAFLIWRKSRIAAIILFSYYFISKLASISAGQATVGLLPAAAILWFLGRAVWATFVWNKIDKTENPDRPKARKWIAWVVGIPAFILACLMILGFAIVSGFMPEYGVVTGEEMHTRQKNVLRENSIIQYNETVLFSYSEGFLDVTYAGSVMTNERIVQYWKIDDKVETASLDLDKINQVQFISQDIYDDVVYTVSSNDESSEALRLTLSTDLDRHLEMIGALEDRIAENFARDAKSTE